MAIFGGGVALDNSANSLIVLDIATGTPLKMFTAASGIDNNIVASPTMLLDANGYIKFVYVADLDGSLYKFDFRTTGLESTGYARMGGQEDLPGVLEPAGVPPGGTRRRQRKPPVPLLRDREPGSPGVRDRKRGNGQVLRASRTPTCTGPPLRSRKPALANLTGNLTTGTAPPTDNGWLINLYSIPANANTADTNTHSGEKVLSDPVVFYNYVYFTTFTPNTSDPCGGGGIARVYGINMINATSGLDPLSARGETGTKVPYHVYSGNPEGGIPSSPSLSIYPSGQSSIFIGFSTGAITEVKIESPTTMKTIKSWKETF